MEKLEIKKQNLQKNIGWNFCKIIMPEEQFTNFKQL